MCVCVFVDRFNDAKKGFCVFVYKVLDMEVSSPS